MRMRVISYPLKPCFAALSELVRNYGSTVVICTATQPNLGELLDACIEPVEITRSPTKLYEALNRVRVINLKDRNDAELSSQLKEHRQVLCIVNTRSHAKHLFDAVSESGNCYHLSARMCPVHRRKQLEKIKALLKENAECRVISTQLIEAGVDIDFPVVYRASTGIDSIAQAAGRCNREGKLPEKGKVCIFKSTEIYGKFATPWQRRVAAIGEMILDKTDDPLSLSSVKSYFHNLYFFEGDDGLDKKGILRSLEDRPEDLAFPFEDVGERFKIIEDITKDIIVPYDENAEKLIENLRNPDFSWKIVRKLQGYTVSIYLIEFNELERAHALDFIGDRFYVLNDKGHYNDKIGLLNEKDNRSEMPLLIVERR